MYSTLSSRYLTCAYAHLVLVSAIKHYERGKHLVYKDFEIVMCRETGSEKNEEKYACTVYDKNDLDHDNIIGRFSVTPERDYFGEIKAPLDHTVRSYVDENYHELNESRLNAENARLKSMLDGTIIVLSRFRHDMRLYDTLRRDVGMSDTEVMRYGTMFASPYARNSSVAQKISDYIASAAVEQSNVSFTGVTYDEINRRFGVYMQDDNLLQKEVSERLEKDHSDVIARASMTDKGIFLDTDISEDMSENNDESLEYTWDLAM